MSDGKEQYHAIDQCAKRVASPGKEATALYYGVPPGILPRVRLRERGALIIPESVHQPCPRSLVVCEVLSHARYVRKPLLATGIPSLAMRKLYSAV